MLTRPALFRLATVWSLPRKSSVPAASTAYSEFGLKTFTPPAASVPAAIVVSPLYVLLAVKASVPLSALVSRLRR